MSSNCTSVRSVRKNSVVGRSGPEAGPVTPVTVSWWACCHGRRRVVELVVYLQTQEKMRFSRSSWSCRGHGVHRDLEQLRWAEPGGVGFVVRLSVAFVWNY